MHIRKLAADFAVSPQIDPTDMSAIAAQGYKSIICNRPDGESYDQPPFSEIEASAKAAGLSARYLPVVPGRTGAADVETFAKLLADLPKPILAFCRSGMRSSSLWSAAQTASHDASPAQNQKGLLRRLFGR